MPIQIIEAIKRPDGSYFYSVTRDDTKKVIDYASVERGRTFDPTFIETFDFPAGTAETAHIDAILAKLAPNTATEELPYKRLDIATARTIAIGRDKDRASVRTSFQFGDVPLNARTSVADNIGSMKPLKGAVPMEIDSEVVQSYFPPEATRAFFRGLWQAFNSAGMTAAVVYGATGDMPATIITGIIAWTSSLGGRVVEGYRDANGSLKVPWQPKKTP